jgi:hypothetical protein
MFTVKSCVAKFGISRFEHTGGLAYLEKCKRVVILAEIQRVCLNTVRIVLFPRAATFERVAYRGNWHENIIVIYEWEIKEHRLYKTRKIICRDEMFIQR